MRTGGVLGEGANIKLAVIKLGKGGGKKHYRIAAGGWMGERVGFLGEGGKNKAQAGLTGVPNC